MYAVFLPGGADTAIALDLVMKAKKALIDSGLLAKDFSTAEEILGKGRIYCDVQTDLPSLIPF